MQTSDYLTSLQNDKQNLTTKLSEKGVMVTGNETFTELIPKLDEIQGGENIYDYIEEDISGHSPGGIGGVLYHIKKLPKLMFNGERADYLLAWLSIVDYIDLSEIDVSNCINMDNMFAMDKKLKQLDLSNFNAPNCTSFNSMFNYCQSLASLDLSNFDFSRAEKVSNMFSNCSNLENLIFGENMGKGFTTTMSNYVYYKQDFSTATKLTHDSLIDVINKLYDLHLTYPSTLYTQQLVLGATNKAKLTAAEIAIATNKGWSVS